MCADSGEAARVFRDDIAQESGMMPPGSAALLAGVFCGTFGAAVNFFLSSH